MCIYYKNQSLPFPIKQEHIFPASLGGKTKLPLGVVSDEANEKFSAYELKMMRHSLIAIDRMLFGPGKRGALSLSKAFQSPITVGVEESGRVVLSFTTMGRMVSISQFCVHNNSVNAKFCFQEGLASQDYYQAFSKQLLTFKDSFIWLTSEHVLKGDMIIGYHKGKFYVATANDVERPSKESIRQEILRFTTGFAERSFVESLAKAKQTHKLYDDEEIARMFAKVAFNALAHLKGSDYVLQSCFDDVRNWIIDGNAEEEFFFLPNILSGEAKAYTKMFPEKSHWCVFVVNEGKLETIVCFYNHISRRFTFGEVPDRSVYPLAFICDWKNQKEYTLSEYALHMAKENHKKISR